MNEGTEQQPKPQGKGRDITDLAKEDIFIRCFIDPPCLGTLEVWARSAARKIKEAILREENPEFSGTTAEWNYKVDRALMADLEARAQLGEKKYGERLRAHNGRRPRVDAYQEFLDAWMYLRQDREEKESPL